MWSSLRVAGKAKKQRVDESERLRLERKAARQKRRREEIIRVAAEIAERAGVDGITAEDVAAALQMSTPSVFYYFSGGLMELRAAVAVQRFWRRFAPAVRAVENAPGGIGVLEVYVRSVMRCYLEDPESFAKDFEVMQRGSWGPELMEVHIGELNALFTIVEKKLEVDRAKGKLHPDVQNLRRIAMLMNQLSLGVFVGDNLRRKVGGTSKHALDALIDDLCGLLRRGVSA